MIAALNKMLAQEHACAIRYATHAAVVKGDSSLAASARLSEIASDEVEHAAMLRREIVILGGKPTMKVTPSGLERAYTLREILHVNIAEEKAAITAYRSILFTIIPHTNLFKTIESIIKDEEEHLHELIQLRPIISNPPSPLTKKQMLKAVRAAKRYLRSKQCQTAFFKAIQDAQNRTDKLRESQKVTWEMMNTPMTI